MDSNPHEPTAPFQPDPRWMHKAIQLSRLAAEQGEVPVGAVIVQGDRLLAQAYNQVELLHDPTAHAEMIAITQAANALGDWRLADCVLYVTKEPCPMCSGAIVLARLPVVVWGMSDPQRGGACSRFKILDDPALNHRTHMVPGLLEEPCREVMQSFFRGRRQEKKRREE
ncbi:MAG TPA: tRNA adenosine(34) deaminase TadA [Kiritimatiellia bacterium]|nr:tRNA adenosine(34) deaminase TadA [Kiritimatiellia bacterium]